MGESKYILKDGRKARSLRLTDEVWEWLQKEAYRHFCKSPAILIDKIARGELEIKEKEES